MKELHEILGKFKELWSGGNSNPAALDMANGYLVSSLITKLYSIQPQIVMEELETYEGNLKFNNYLTTSELATICQNVVNYDNTRGCKIKDWEGMLSKIEGCERIMEPYYNENALKAAICICYSENGNVILEAVGSDALKFYNVLYKMAKQKLMREKYIRDYLDKLAR